VNRRVVEVPVEGRFIVNDDRMAMQAVLEGAGLLQMPRSSVERDLAAKRLVTVLDDFQQPPLAGFFLFYPSRRQIRPALKVLVEFLRKRDKRA
jgi:DNA-binding transcriptional LysR family regulator